MTNPAAHVQGIHHVTSIASDPQRNIDFYAKILGLRLVKVTVNFDDPTTYHLYYGDELGRPGTILTFFPWPNAPKGRRGNGQAVATSFSIPENATDFWMDRFKHEGIGFTNPSTRFGGNEQVITFYDPDGLELELVAHKSASHKNNNIWKNSPIPFEYAIRGFYSVTLAVEGYERTASVLTKQLGFQPTHKEGSRFRYEITRNDNNDNDKEGPGSIVDVLCLPYSPPGSMGVGTVHHVAWRTPTDKQQTILRRDILKQGYNATPVIDRIYFHSVYFREPGGVLFEIATNPPGFAIDEEKEELGNHLMLPPWLEPDRKGLEKILPKINLPFSQKTAKVTTREENEIREEQNK
ncbi:MAG TPA: ring-cleaving dioxygenase [Nitrososphaeraceae archaeon]|nr:ring-cleaving dioxygenase [Nitrososphaeraceae archaeon]